MLNAIIGKIKVWWAHHRDAGAGQYPFHCYYCNITLRAPEGDVLEYVSAHLRHPSHRTAEARAQGYIPSATDVRYVDPNETARTLETTVELPDGEVIPLRDYRSRR